MNSKSDSKKLLGAYYTPSAATIILSNWAIRSHSDRILEPSFGGCDFLNQAISRLTELGARNPIVNLFGADVDVNAFKILSQKIRVGSVNGNFIKSDFLKLEKHNFNNDGFDVVIGNPPYISNHNMDEVQRNNATSSMKRSGFKLSPKASLWAYFVLYSTKFLKKNARMAWILPGSFLYSDYSIYVKDTIEKSFISCAAFQLNKRIFLPKGTDESTVVLLCEGFKKNKKNSSIISVFNSEDLIDLEKHINAWKKKENKSNNLQRRVGKNFLSNEVLRIYNTISKHKNCYALSKCLDVKIGIVTGANKFFIINQEKADFHKLPNHALKPILSKFGMSKGMEIDTNDVIKSKIDNFPCLLVDTSKMSPNDSTHKYIESFDDSLKENNKTFKKRKIWHRPDDGNIPDAFFPYMQNYGPRLVLNKCKLTSTNTIHRIYFKKGIHEYLKKLICVSIISTYSQLSAEIEGRSYGSGVLKHEPSEVKRIKVYLPVINRKERILEIYRIVNSLLLEKKFKQAQNVADKFIFRGLFGKLGRDFLTGLCNELLEARLRRWGK